MAIQNTFPVVVSDGDQLSEGYFRGLAGDLIANSARVFREGGIAGTYGNDFREETDFTSLNLLDDATITTTDGWFDSGIGLYFFGFNYDDYNSSFDTTKFTGSGDGSNAETTSYIQREFPTSSQNNARTVTLTNKGSGSSANVYPTAGTISEGCIKIHIFASQASGTGLRTATWYITDGSTDIIIIQNTLASGGAIAVDDSFFYTVDSSGDTITTFTAFGGSANVIDISTLIGTEWYFKLEGEYDGNGSSANTNIFCRFYSHVFVNGSGGVTIPTSSMVSSSTTTNKSNSLALVTHYGENLTVSLSTNGGSNYTVGADKTIVATTAGATFQVKVEASDVEPNELPKFSELVGQSLE